MFVDSLLFYHVVFKIPRLENMWFNMFNFKDLLTGAVMNQIQNQFQQLRTFLTSQMKNQIEPINASIRNLVNKTSTNHELVKNEIKDLQDSVSRDMAENTVTLTTEMKKTGKIVETLVTDLRRLTNVDELDEEEANKGPSENQDVVVDQIFSPDFYKERIKNHDPLEKDGYMRREEIIFFIQNFEDSLKVDKGWQTLLKVCRDIITFLYVVFEQFTFDARITAAFWTAPEVIDDETGK